VLVGYFRLTQLSVAAFRRSRCTNWPRYGKSACHFGSVSHKQWASLYRIDFTGNVFGKKIIKKSSGFAGSPKVKVKLSHYRSDRSLGFQENEFHRLPDNRHMNVVRLPFTPTRYPLYSLLLEAESTPGP
jgi:hypothetical protein